MKSEMVCIVCPVSCHLEVTKVGDDFIVEGNQCKRGPIYAEKELTNPTRVVTSTVRIEKGLYNRLPVSTNGEIPKGMIFDVMSEINKVVLKVPINCGDIIIKNVLETGVDIVASRSMY
ncbi:DUF1667 domain-containing protein [Mycoplasmatota bacterium WC44]